SSPASLHSAIYALSLHDALPILGSRSGASLADFMVMPMTVLAPIDGVVANPDGGLLGFRVSKFRYFASVLSMALATPSEPGLLGAEEQTSPLDSRSSLGARLPLK